MGPKLNSTRNQDSEYFNFKPFRCTTTLAFLVGLVSFNKSLVHYTVSMSFHILKSRNLAQGANGAKTAQVQSLFTERYKICYNALTNTLTHWILSDGSQDHDKSAKVDSANL